MGVVRKHIYTLKSRRGDISLLTANIIWYVTVCKPANIRCLLNSSVPNEPSDNGRGSHENRKLCLFATYTKHRMTSFHVRDTL
jgi:hypothetical protein